MSTPPTPFPPSGYGWVLHSLKEKSQASPSKCSSSHPASLWLLAANSQSTTHHKPWTTDFCSNGLHFTSYKSGTGFFFFSQAYTLSAHNKNKEQDHTHVLWNSYKWQNKEITSFKILHKAVHRKVPSETFSRICMLYHIFLVAPNQPQSMCDLSSIKMTKKFQKCSWSNFITVVITIIMHIVTNVRDGRATDFPRRSIRITIY